MEFEAPRTRLFYTISKFAAHTSIRFYFLRQISLFIIEKLPALGYKLSISY